MVCKEMPLVFILCVDTLQDAPCESSVSSNCSVYCACCDCLASCATSASGRR